MDTAIGVVVPHYNIDELLFFPGKELSDVNISVTGKRMAHRPIRIGVGVDGVYKFHADEDEVMTFWMYSDIADWSYSGYSFTLNLKGKVDYHVRTNDGPSISQWIESFSKCPSQALVDCRKFKALGDSHPIPSKQPVFYTLNNRKRNSRSTDTNSRLLSAYGVDRKQYSNQSISAEIPANGTDLKRWSTGVAMERDSKKSSTYRSSSMDVLDQSSVAQEPRAKSMECLLNGTTTTTTTTTATTTTTNSTPNRSSTNTDLDNSIGETSSNDSSHVMEDNEEEEEDDDETDEEEPPVAPPRNASLKPYQVNQPITIQISDIEKQPPVVRKPHPHTYEEIEIGVPSRYNNKLEITKRDTESDYDHLFPGKKQAHKPGVRRKKSKDSDDPSKEEIQEIVFSPIRRNESLPPMVFHSPVVEKPEVPPKDDESGVSDSEMDEPVSPLPGEYRTEEGVVMRQKPCVNDGPDPFADLLAAPPNKSRLRWSQELNPIYDYVKGVKISPKLGYDSLATKAENVIEEEDPSMGTEEDTTSVCSSDHRSSSGSQFEGLVFVPQSAPNTLQRKKKVPHNYEEVVFGRGPTTEVVDTRGRSDSGGSNRPMSEHYSHSHIEEITNKSRTIRNTSPLRRLKSSETPFAISPQLNKRVLHRKSKTVRSNDDSNAPQGRQQARRVADTMRDFSYITREYRVFFIKMPTGHLISEVVNINKPVCTLVEKLAELLGSRTIDSYSLYVEGSILTTMKEAGLEFGELQPAKAQVNTSSVSLTHLVDNNSLADQGEIPILLKLNLTFRVQGITTARILRLDDTDDVMVTDLRDTVGSVKHEFHKAWLSVVQGNQPTTLENAVKLAAMQYQAYFLERTAEHSVIGFCRPTEFLPAEFAGVRAIEGKIYKEQEKIKSRSQPQIQKAYVDYCRSLPTSSTLFFPVREARRRLLHSAKLKPVLLGINKRGIMRVCPKTKEVLESWDYQVLKNWAYSRRTFVVAFSNKNYPVESNQAKWISDLVDFHVHSIVQSSTPPPGSTQSSK